MRLSNSEHRAKKEISVSCLVSESVVLLHCVLPVVIVHSYFTYLIVMLNAYYYISDLLQVGWLQLEFCLRHL